MVRILIVDDEPSICELIRISLCRSGYECVCAYTGTDAANLVEKESFDLILLDVMLPGIDGFELMDYISYTGTPVIFITAKNSVNDRVKGLRMGAEDYIVKPFDTLELLARVDGVLRRHGKTQTIIVVGDVSVNTLSMQVLKNDIPIHLTKKEYEILLLFTRKPGIVLSKPTIYERVWGGECPESSRTVELHIQRMKKKLCWDTQIKPVFGIGYRLEV